MEKGEADTTKGRPDNKNDVQINGVKLSNY
jgi:hypothetical protein